MRHKCPNLIIIGVHKAGTTSLHRYLGEHPDIFASLIKELHYFTPLIYGGSLSSVDTYAAHFEKSSNSKIRLESSPAYLYGKEIIINNVRKVAGDVKFIVVLREPVQRFVSFYKQMISSLRINEKETIDDFFDKSLKAFYEEDLMSGTPYYRSIREGVYLNYIKPWLSLGREQFHVVFFNQIRDSPHQLLLEISNFLGIDGGFYENYTFAIENNSMKPKNVAAHNIVYNFYMKYEVFFRKHTAVKKILKSIYDTVNHKEFSDGLLSQDNIELLNDIYSLPNKQLGRLLKDSGYTDMPTWLN